MTGTLQHDRGQLLMQRIDNYPLDCLQNFLARLQKENLWNQKYAARVIKEYKRFMFLSAVSSEPVTPSLEVDECWHLHILYTRDYQEFCNILGKFIHHGPGTGTEEDVKFIQWYISTGTRYFMWFSEKPPDDIWPPAQMRFRPVHFVKVDLVEYWVVHVGNVRKMLRCTWRSIKWKIKKLWY